MLRCSDARYLTRQYLSSYTSSAASTVGRDLRSIREASVHMRLALARMAIWMVFLVVFSCPVLAQQGLANHNVLRRDRSTSSPALAHLQKRAVDARGFPPRSDGSSLTTLYKYSQAPVGGNSSLILRDFLPFDYPLLSGFTPTNSPFCFRNEEAWGSYPFSSTKIPASRKLHNANRQQPGFGHRGRSTVIFLIFYDRTSKPSLGLSHLRSSHPVYKRVCCYRAC
jgi:hypothetical protein